MVGEDDMPNEMMVGGHAECSEALGRHGGKKRQTWRTTHGNTNKYIKTNYTHNAGGLLRTYATPRHPEHKPSKAKNSFRSVNTEKFSWGLNYVIHWLRPFRSVKSHFWRDFCPNKGSRFGFYTRYNLRDLVKRPGRSKTAGRGQIGRICKLKLVGAQLRFQRLRMKVSTQAPRLNRAYFFWGCLSSSNRSRSLLVSWQEGTCRNQAIRLGDEKRKISGNF